MQGPQTRTQPSFSIRYENPKLEMAIFAHVFLKEFYGGNKPELGNKPVLPKIENTHLIKKNNHFDKT